MREFGVMIFIVQTGFVSILVRVRRRVQPVSWTDGLVVMRCSVYKVVI